ncbi:NAD-dependent epimerase/dehydratase family protein [Acuticoccus kandeliae]|uniref:NAD-dependent epimerase/dehydratase family protein n=1 Tax=Acuticoccus kandeliae TaxID=2073160 RepID=UPI000D3E7E0C|nr:NAD(P)-dependent oxidoreductase [Acuticoccus kandeliae]
MAMRVLVTGAAGHLGRHVTAALTAAGHEVHAVDAAPFAGEAAQVTVADLAVWDGLGAAAREADAIVHLAAIPNLDNHPEDVVYRTNVTLAARVAFAAIEAKIGRYVYASSQTVLGQSLAPSIVAPVRLPVDEDHPLVPREGYGLSKLAGEGLAALVAERLGVAAFALRLPVIWAPETFAAHVGKRRGNPVQAVKSLWAYVDARDAGEAFRLAVEVEADGFAALQIGADRPFVDGDIREAVAAAYPGVPRGSEIGPATPIFSIERARRVLGYAPRHRWHAGGIDTRNETEAA